jgi:hypothetical protein
MFPTSRSGGWRIDVGTLWYVDHSYATQSRIAVAAGREARGESIYNYDRYMILSLKLKYDPDTDWYQRQHLRTTHTAAQESKTGCGTKTLETCDFRIPSKNPRLRSLPGTTWDSILGAWDLSLGCINPAGHPPWLEDLPDATLLRLNTVIVAPRNH